MDKITYDLKEEWNSAKGTQGLQPLACDTEKYREHIEEFELSDEEQSELLKTLWTIMAAFVDLGFGVDSIQFLPKDDDSSRLLKTEAEEHNQNLNDSTVLAVESHELKGD